MLIFDFVLSSHQSLNRKKRNLDWNLQQIAKSIKHNLKLEDGLLWWESLSIWKVHYHLQTLKENNAMWSQFWALEIIYDFISIQETCSTAMTMLCTAFVWPPSKLLSFKRWCFTFASKGQSHKTSAASAATHISHRQCRDRMRTWKVISFNLIQIVLIKSNQISFNLNKKRLGHRQRHIFPIDNVDFLFQLF